MDLKLPIESRQVIVDYFLSENNPNFSCSTQYDEAQEIMQNIFVLLADDLSDLQVLETVLHSKIKNVVQNSYWSAREKIATLFNLAKDPKVFLDKEFNILADAKAKFEFEFNVKTSSSQFVTDVFLKIGLDISSSRTIPLRQTIDEFVMNAQYNAPAQAAGLLNLKEVPNSLLVIEMNEKLLAVTVIDHYGTLTISKFLTKIENSLKIGPDKSINYGHGGAGLGGSLVYKHCDTLLMACEPLKKTRVTSVLPLNLNEDKLLYIQKSICILD